MFSVTRFIWLVTLFVSGQTCTYPKVAMSSHYRDFGIIKTTQRIHLWVQSCSIEASERICSSQISYKETYFEDCQLTAEDGYQLFGGKYFPVSINGTTSYFDQKLIINEFENKKYCDGNEGHQTKTSNFTMTIKKYLVTSELLSNRVLLNSGINCRYDLGTCFDPNENSYFWWSSTSPVVYTNHMIMPVDQQEEMFVLTLLEEPRVDFALVQQFGKTFALQLIKKHIKGNLTLWKTDRKDLSIFFYSENSAKIKGTFKNFNTFKGLVNSQLPFAPDKIVYDEMHCRCEKQQLRNDFEKIKIRPDASPCKETNQNFAEANFLDTNANVIVIASLGTVVFFLIVFAILMITNAIINYNTLSGVDDTYGCYTIKCSFIQALANRYLFQILENRMKIGSSRQKLLSARSSYDTYHEYEEPRNFSNS